jgi:hypothetical protein
MANPCSPHTSQPAPGVPQVIAVGGAAIASAIAIAGYPTVAELLAPIIVDAPFESATFCAADPPTDPGLNATIISDALNFQDLATSLPAIAQVRDWFLHWYWYQICVCSAGTQPTPPALSNPNTTGGSNPGLPGAQPAGNCWDASYTVTVPAGGTVGICSVDLYQQLLPTAGGVLLKTPLASQGSLQHFVLIDSTAPTHVTMVTTGDRIDATNSYGSLLGWFNTTTPTSWTHVENDIGFSGVVATTGMVPTYPASYLGVGAYNGDTIAHTMTIEVSFQCSNSTGPPQQPCCPPDPNVAIALQQILSLLETIYSTLPVRVPTYVAGTAHAGLTGGGTIVLAATTIAVQAAVTTLPAVYGVEAGTPLTYFDIGWVSPVTAEGVEAGIRITRQTQAIPLPEATTSLDYSLQPGEVVTITELQAG